MIAIMLCCLWVACWFWEASVTIPPTNTIEFDSAYVHGTYVYGTYVYEDDPPLFGLHPYVEVRFRSIFIILPFLIWPLGRLTRRIMKRPEKIPALPETDNNMGRKLFKWFRRTHDVIAITLCCLWVAGWFVVFCLTTVNRTELNVFKTYVVDAGLFHANEMKASQSLEPGSHFEMSLVPSRRQLLDQNLSIWKRLLTNRPLGKWHRTQQAQEGLVFFTTFPSILIVLPFLIWPLGRLTHRIVRRKDKIPNPA